MRDKRLLWLIGMLAVCPLIYGQPPTCLDGNNCGDGMVDCTTGDEWGPPTVIDVVGDSSGSADLENIWVNFDFDARIFFMAFDRQATGSANIAFFFNLDCIDNNNDVTRGGADFGAFLTISGAGTTNGQYAPWTTQGGGGYTATGSLPAAIGFLDCTNTPSEDGLFGELSVDLTQLIADGFYDPCECDSITITSGSSLNGTSLNSSDADASGLQFTVDINDQPEIPAPLPDFEACLDDATFSFDGSGATDADIGTSRDDTLLYLWDFGDGNNSTEISPTHTYTTPGSYTGSLTVTDQFMCDSVLTFMADVYAYPVADAIVTGAEICDDKTINYDCSPSIDSFGGSNYSVQWSFGDGNTSTTCSGTHTYTDECGTFEQLELVITDLSTGCTDTFRQELQLPITLVYFEAVQIEQSRIELNWQTETETNSEFFYVQRKLEGTTDFETIAQLNAAGNSTTTINYSYTDEVDHLQANLVYYRLLEVDFDGSEMYSDVVAVQLNRASPLSVSIAPNPVHDQLMINVTGHSSNFDMLISDLSGNVVYQKHFSGIEAFNGIYINSDRFTAGIYLVSIVSNNNTVQSKFAVLE